MVYRFAEFELDLPAREFRQDGEPVGIEPKVFELLHLLIQHRRLVIRRDVLASEIWPGIVVGQASLSRLVKELRRLVGDNGHEQKVIRTVRGTGYQFVGDLDEQALASDRSEFDVSSERIDHARMVLENAVERDTRDIRVHIEQFVQSCQLVLDSARSERK